MPYLLFLLSGLAALLNVVPVTHAQTLEQQLLSEAPSQLIDDAKEQGDAVRGAIVFHQPFMACSRCHQFEASKVSDALGPNIAVWEQRPTDTYLLNAILNPSKDIRKGFEPIQVVTAEGQVINGLLHSESGDQLSLRDPANGRIIRIATDEIDDRVNATTSVMPAGQVNQLTSRQQFLDLLRYVMELRDGGLARAKELQPPPSMFALKIPEYESRVDHAGLLEDLNEDSFKRGEAIYNRLCINCHGDHQKPGSLPTALRFAEGKFRNGNDPYAMYRTLTHGFGFMVAQTWMVPQQKYDVIHYIRQAYLREHNPSQYADISEQYLAGLPKGDTRGPKPTRMDKWATMDYGPRLINTYEVGADGSNFAQKGIAVRLDPGPGGVARGSAWMIFDHDTMRMAATWTTDPKQPENRFIDWNGIQFNGRHGIHPRIVGDLHVANSTGPGWSDPATGSLKDTQRVQGRDGRRYGPLPRTWAQYKGLHAAGERTIVHYTVSDTDVLEMPGMIPGSANESPVFTRTLDIGPRSSDLTLVVGTAPGNSAALTTDGLTAQLSASGDPQTEPGIADFDGSTWLETGDQIRLDMTTQDFSIRARVRTAKGGTIFSRTTTGNQWVPDAKALFIRKGRLCYDIGWVGVVESRDRINDGQWHDVAVTWERSSGTATLYIDGELQRRKVLRPKKRVSGHVARIGFASPNFPARSGFHGDISRVRFWQRALRQEELTGRASQQALVADWNPLATDGLAVADESSNDHDMTVHSNAAPVGNGSNAGLIAGLSMPVPGARWTQEGQRLCLTLPAGDSPLKFVLWFARQDSASDVEIPQIESTPDLQALKSSNPRLWKEQLSTQLTPGEQDGAFAVDFLMPPESNPWLAQTRLTGLDFFEDGNTLAACSWDGDVWIVKGLATADRSSSLSWQRIANGLFQPLGLTIINGQIYVTCRDQIVILEDHNGDGETDYYRCFNNDHQVTEHFHEFAMGLQADDDGNLYYAKSARHAKKAVVPHHGTLLRVSADGETTDILATGFRAANGVCLNPDGTFVVTDQEGHWNPKNRINWVHEGGFYGNMFGYHDVTDSSDDAMQPPLCWITNAFDRSPGELLWVDSKSWGPLNGSLLNLSYGYGKVYVVPFENVSGQPQGGMCELPIPQFPTGTMRGRFHRDGHLYVCGMFAWAGSQQHPGGLYRLRPTGKPAWLPVRLETQNQGLSITFTDELDPSQATNPDAYRIKVWSIKRTASYGSEHYNEHSLDITAAALSDDRKTITLTVPDIEPTWCMEIRCSIQTPDGGTEERVIHNTIHELNN